MADTSWRRALSEDEIPAAFRNVYGDRSETPLSVQMADVGVEFTPAGTIFGLNDIKEELQKEEPDYYKIGMMAGAEAIGLIPGLGDAAVAAIKAGAKKAGLDKVADQTDALLSSPKPNPELEIFGGARAQYPPNMTGYGSIDSTFNAEADFKTLENLSIDFENDPTGSLIRVMDELERNPSKYPATLKEVVAGNWFRGRDDLMRFEIDDSQSEILGNGVGDIVRMDEDDMDAYLRGFSFNVDSKFPDNSIQGMPGEKAFTTLEDILKHDQLYNQYPQLRNAPVIEDTAYFKRNPSVLGYFDDSSGTIAINTNKIATNEELRDTLLHEVQHLVQHLEGFESGTNVRNADVLEIKKAVEGSPEYQKAFADYNAKVSEYLKNRDSATVAVYDKNKEVASKVLDMILDDFSAKTEIPVEEIYERLNKGETFDSIKMSVPPDIRARGFIYPPEFERILHIAEGNVGGMAPNSSIDLNRSLDDVNPRESAAPYFEMLSGKDRIDLIADNNRWQQNRLSSTISSLIKDNPELAKDFENSLGFSAQDFIDASKSQDRVGKLYGIADVVPPTKPKIVRNYVIYSSKRGEVEARNVSARKDMAASERTPENVFDTEDTPANRQWGEPELKRARSGQNPVTGFTNGPSASSLTLEDFGYYVDNPAKWGNTDWAKQKQAYAEKYAREGGKSAKKLLSGPQTAFLGIDNKKPLYLDTEFLSTLKGANDEVADMSNPKYVDLKKSVEEEGFVPDQKGNKILIGINHKGEAFIMEGNNRVAIAKEFGAPSVKAEVRYYNGAEEVNGPYSPQNILKYASQAPRQFAEGGKVGNMSMKKQMSLFEYGGIADDGMTKDPVSGNDIPPGSLAKEVRDDIPAMLSEGEYVVPADVLRFYGVNFFENLRNQAKSGLQNMEQNGRIGGTPMTQQDVARNMQQPMATPAPVQAAQGAMMQSPIRIQQQAAPQAMGNTVPQQQQPVMANQGAMIQGFNDGPMPTAAQYRSSWTPGRARWNTQMFQGTSSQQANVEKAKQEATSGTSSGTAGTGTEQVTLNTYMRTHYDKEGNTAQIAYEGTTPDGAKPKAGQEELLSQYPLTEAEYKAYLGEMKRSNNDGDGDTDPVTQGSDTSWMDGIDYTDEASVREWAETSLGLSKMEQMGTKVGGALLGGAAALSQARDIAEVRAMAQIQRAAGNTELAKFLEGEAQKAVDEGPLALSAFDKLGFMTGEALAEQGMELVGTTIQMQKAMAGAGTDSVTMTSPGLSGDTAASRAEIAKEEELMSQTATAGPGGTGSLVNNNNDDDVPSHEEIMSMHDRIQKEVEDYAASGKKFDMNDPSTWANNEGGLMAAPKAKKKRGRPKKSGLAGKK